MYTAVVLNKHCRLALVEVARAKFVAKNPDFRFETPRGDALPHHMTLNMGMFDESLNDPSFLGMSAALTVDALCGCRDLGVCAARVRRATVDKAGSVFELKSANTHPHITLCLRPDTKPVLSNRLPWESDKLVVLPELVIVYGIVAECQ